MLAWLASTLWELSSKGTVVLRLFNVLVPETDKTEVSVFVTLLVDDKLEVTSLGSCAGEVALFAVKWNIKKMSV